MGPRVAFSGKIDDVLYDQLMSYLPNDYHLRLHEQSGLVKAAVKRSATADRRLCGKTSTTLTGHRVPPSGGL